MGFGQNGMGPCGKRAKWSLGKMGKLGEMASGRNEKWAKMKLGKRAGQTFGIMGKGRSSKGRKNRNHSSPERCHSMRRTRSTCALRWVFSPHGFIHCSKI